MIVKKLSRKFWRSVTVFYFKHIFRYVGNKSIIVHPMRIDNAKSIYIGNNVTINKNAWLMGSFDADKSLLIKDRTAIGHYAHIVAQHSVTIEENVLIADKVFISDCTHNYDNIKIPIIDQKIHNLSPVVIGEDSWIGENVCILGASIGKHCVIGSNSVVTKNIPDFSIAVGNPAIVIKKYDFKTNEWIKVDK